MKILREPEAIENIKYSTVNTGKTAIKSFEYT